MNEYQFFFIEWERIRQTSIRWPNSTKRLTNVCTAILWILITANAGFSAYLIFVTNLEDAVLTPWDREFKYFIVILSFAWVATSVFMFVISRALASEFTEVTHGIETLAARGEGFECMGTLEGLRRQHQNICNLVEKADRIRSSQVAISFSGSLVITCLLLYSLVYDDHSNSNGTWMVVIKVFWICIALAKVIIDCISGAMLNDAKGSYT